MEHLSKMFFWGGFKGLCNVSTLLGKTGLVDGVFCQNLHSRHLKNAVSFQPHFSHMVHSRDTEVIKKLLKSC